MRWQCTLPAATPPNTVGVHIVAPGETLIKIARLYNKPLVEIAKANNIPPHTKVNIGDRIVIPGLRVIACAEGAGDQGRRSQAGGPSNASRPPSRQARTGGKAAGRARAGSGKRRRRDANRTGCTHRRREVAGASDAPPGFRWPVHGRMIAGFGPRPNGQQNDGINVAVPEGTPVKAAEDGVVAYAGNELKGYGNLVLVRHANGYVTAYAHAKELLVKRGDQIKRGQVIAQVRPDRQRRRAAAPLRNPQGTLAGRSDADAERRIGTGSERDQATESYLTSLFHGPPV